MARKEKQRKKIVNQPSAAAGSVYNRAGNTKNSEHVLEREEEQKSGTKWTETKTEAKTNVTANGSKESDKRSPQGKEAEKKSSPKKESDKKKKKEESLVSLKKKEQRPEKSFVGSNWLMSPKSPLQSSMFLVDDKEVFEECVTKIIEDWVESLSKMGVRGIREEFVKEKRSVIPQSSYEAFTDNEARNRYDDVILLDKTRVKLQNSDDDYLHASFVQMSPGYTLICAQAPMSNTSGYFYRMAIEQQCNVIVMLCDFKERSQKTREPVDQQSQKQRKDSGTKTKTNKTRSTTGTTTRSKDREEPEEVKYQMVQKSYDYVPLEEGDFLVFGALTVRNKKTKSVGGMKGSRELEKVVQRELEITDVRTKKVYTIIHLHYASWPDHRVPTSPFTCLEVCNIARVQAREKPVLVHCSAGIGRTGTVALIELAVQKMTKPDRAQMIAPFRMVDALNEIRMARWHSVQTDQQYVFAHRCVIEHLVDIGALAKNTRVQKFIMDHENFQKRKAAEMAKKC
ncbi:hypothetical protein L596_023773 [Steinernema carpocapsae]|uniref:Tyrosine-protein phosphatase domain-containing protein n=2 Tax=Steinernema carpocapsae TaxID=34508 RepID=A0A4U5MEP0_STECR|nr:hypothetical protein L596_023773 [Steinernema carpocapsae]